MEPARLPDDTVRVSAARRSWQLVVDARAEIVLSIALFLGVVLVIEGVASLMPTRARSLRLVLYGCALLALCGYEMLSTIARLGLYSLTRDDETESTDTATPATDVTDG